MMGKSDYLKGQAVALGLCREWTNAWGDGLSDEELCERFLRGIDFCIKHDWPDKEYIKAHFDEDFRHRHGVFVDEDLRDFVAHYADLDKVVLLGDCRGVLQFTGFSVCSVYVRHDSVVTIDANNLSLLHVYAYDRSKVHVVGDSAHNVYVYSYDDSFITKEGRVIVRERGYHDEL